MGYYCLKIWERLCDLGRVFLIYVLIYQQVYMGVVWANGGLREIQADFDDVHLQRKYSLPQDSERSTISFSRESIKLREEFQGCDWVFRETQGQAQALYRWQGKFYEVHHPELLQSVQVLKRGKDHDISSLYIKSLLEGFGEKNLIVGLESDGEIIIEDGIQVKSLVTYAPRVITRAMAPLDSEGKLNGIDVEHLEVHGGFKVEGGSTLNVRNLSLYQGDFINHGTLRLKAGGEVHLYGNDLINTHKLKSREQVTFQGEGCLQNKIGALLKLQRGKFLVPLINHGFLRGEERVEIFKDIVNEGRLWLREGRLWGGQGINKGRWQIDHLAGTSMLVRLENQDQMVLGFKPGATLEVQTFLNTGTMNSQGMALAVKGRFENHHILRGERTKIEAQVFNNQGTLEEGMHLTLKSSQVVSYGQGIKSAGSFALYLPETSLDAQAWEALWKVAQVQEDVRVQAKDMTIMKPWTHGGAAHLQASGPLSLFTTLEAHGLNITADQFLGGSEERPCLLRSLGPLKMDVGHFNGEWTSLEATGPLHVQHKRGFLLGKESEGSGDFEVWDGILPKNQKVFYKKQVSNGSHIYTPRSLTIEGEHNMAINASSLWAGGSIVLSVPQQNWIWAQSAKVRSLQDITFKGHAASLQRLGGVITIEGVPYYGKFCECGGNYKWLRRWHDIETSEPTEIQALGNIIWDVQERYTCYSYSLAGKNNTYELGKKDVPLERSLYDYGYIHCGGYGCGQQSFRSSRAWHAANQSLKVGSQEIKGSGSYSAAKIELSTQVLHLFKAGQEAYTPSHSLPREIHFKDLCDS